MRLTLALLLCATPAICETLAPGTLLICREHGQPTGQTLMIVAPGVYADQTGARGGYVWDHRGFDFISGPFAGVQAEARPGVIRLSPTERGPTLVCSP